MISERTCSACGETKPFARGHWLWSAARGAYGSRCHQCCLDRYRGANTRRRFFARRGLIDPLKNMPPHFRDLFGA